MKDSIIKKYLDFQFIKVETVEEITFIEESVSEVKTILESSTADLVSASLLVLDPAPEADDLVDKVDKIVQARWTLFRNKNKNEKAITIIRAILLEAISQIIEADIERLAIVWLTIKNNYPHSSLGREAKLISEWVQNLHTPYITETYSRWGMPTIEKGILRTDKVLKQIEKTISDNFVNLDKTTVAQYPEWKKEFVTALTNSLASVLAKQFGVKELAETQNSLNQRNQLLWLKESKYSFSINKPYSKISGKILPLVMASDISKLTSRFIPQSIETFIDSLWSDMVESNGNKITLKEFYEQVQKDESIKCLFELDDRANCKRNLLQYLAQLSNDKTSVKSGENITGLKSGSQMTHPELTVWLLNDFLALKKYE